MTAKHCACGVFVTADYARGVLVIFSFWVMFSHPWLAFAAHFTSSLLDEFDGSVARRLDQCSLFGGQLDMVLDRCETSISEAAFIHVFGRSCATVAQFFPKICNHYSY